MAKLNASEFHQLSAVHSPASTLPPEILSLIFRHACTIPDQTERHDLPPLPQKPGSLSCLAVTRTPLFLGAVCVYWRQISFSTPHIWTYLYLYIDTELVNNASAILQMFLTHSRRLPLVIAITFNGFWAYHTKSLVDAPSDAVLRENAHRIEELYLYDVPDTWIDFLPSLSHLVNLCIEISSFCPPPCPAVIIQSQCPHLTLKSFHGSVNLSCSNLATLHLHGGDVGVCLKMLMAYPNLIEFRASELWDEEGLRIALPEDSFVLPYMETFEWHVDTTCSFDAAILRNIRMPVLRELIWVEEIYYDFEPADPANVFFQNLPPTLVELHFHKAMAHETASGLVSIFDYVPDSLGIERLIFSDVDDLFLDCVFEGLTPAPEGAGSQQGVKLPKLNAILIMSVDKSLPILTKDNETAILRMLERRFLCVGGPNPELFRLEFPPDVAWTPLFEEGIKELTGRGLKVGIFMGTDLVDWL